jgi:hypothetical protein
MGKPGDGDGPDDAEIVRSEMHSTEVEVVRDNSTLVALQRAEIDQAIVTAKAYPRDIAKFKNEVRSMALLDQETAASMYYTLPRDGKTIQDGSIRLAEIAGSCWGNVRYGASVIEVGDDYLVARGACHDLERNVNIALDVRRRITNRHGARFNADMIMTTGQAACSIALRNAIFKVVPKAYLKPVVAEAKRVAAGTQQSLVANRDAALEWFKKRGVEKDRVLALCGVKSKDEITLEHISEFVGIRAAVKEGEAKLEDFFKEKEPEQPKGPVSVASLSSGTVKASNDSKERVIEPEPAVVTKEEIEEGAAALVDGPKAKAQAATADAAKAHDKAVDASKPKKPEPKVITETVDKAAQAASIFED